jgi:hypothetical protein
MTERSWPNLPIGQFQLTSFDRNEMREISLFWDTPERVFFR